MCRSCKPLFSFLFCAPEIPLFHVLNARVTFSNLCGCDEAVSSVTVHNPENTEEAGNYYLMETCYGLQQRTSDPLLSTTGTVHHFCVVSQVSLRLPSTVRLTLRCLSPLQTTPSSVQAAASQWGMRMTTCCSSPSSRACWTPARKAIRSERDGRTVRSVWVGLKRTELLRLCCLVYVFFFFFYLIVFTSNVF